MKIVPHVTNTNVEEAFAVEAAETLPLSRKKIHTSVALIFFIKTASCNKNLDPIQVT